LGSGELYLLEGDNPSDLANILVELRGGGEPVSLSQAKLGEGVGRLGKCNGRTPWLGSGARTDGGCTLPAKLVTRSSSDSYFPQALSVISIPDNASELTLAVREYWGVVGELEDISEVEFV